MTRPEDEGSKRVLELPIPLSRLDTGRAAHITHIDHQDRAAERKLVALGMLPGVRVELQQRSPAYVLRIGRTQLAIDATLADAVRVRIA